MNNPISVVVFSSVLIAVAPISFASPVEELLASYRNQGTEPFSIQRGEQLWLREHQGRRCASCHSEDPRAQGKHQKTGKAIKPLAPSVNPERLGSEKNINKWLKRNCKWTLARECTAQEKGDFLTWLRAQ